MTLRILVPIRTTNPLNGSGGLTRGARMAEATRRRKQRETVAFTLRAVAREVPPLPCVVTLTRVAPSNGLDDDALPAALKSIRDEVAVALGLPPRKVRGRRAHAEDRDPRVTWKYDQRRGAQGEYAVEIAIAPRAA